MNEIGVTVFIEKIKYYEYFTLQNTPEALKALETIIYEKFPSILPQEISVKGEVICPSH